MNRLNRRRRQPKSTLKLEGDRGEFILTPALSKKTNTNVKDLERIVLEHGRKINKDLYLNLAIVQQGVKVQWGLESDLNLEEMEIVETDE